MVCVPGDSTLVYIAGQLGFDEQGKLIANDYATQLQQAFANLRTALAAIGALDLPRAQ